MDNKNLLVSSTQQDTRVVNLLFDLAKNNKIKQFTKTLNNLNTNPQAYILFSLLLTKNKDFLTVSNLFREVNNIIMEKQHFDIRYVLKNIGFPSLLRKCTVEESPCLYCEGKGFVQISGKKTGTHCPRLHGPCPLGEKSPVFADLNREAKDWDLREILVYTGLIKQTSLFPEYISNKPPIQYVSQVSGAFNRVNEIRDHLFCRHCKEPMHFNLKFSSRFMAVYAATVADCKTPDPTKLKHDHDIYLNHCRGCGRVIDSRDTPVQEMSDVKRQIEKKFVSGYYLCTHCGSGSPDFPAGAACPVCGATNIDRSKQEHKCKICGHKFTPEKFVLDKFADVRIKRVDKKVAVDSQYFLGEKDFIKTIYFTGDTPPMTIRISPRKQKNFNRNVLLNDSFAEDFGGDIEIPF